MRICPGVEGHLLSQDAGEQRQDGVWVPSCMAVVLTWVPTAAMHHLGAG